MDGRELNPGCDCYAFERFADFNKIPINKQDLNLLNMNISSLSAPIFKIFELFQHHLHLWKQTKYKELSFEKRSHNLRSDLNICNPKELNKTM